ncbi:MAG: hypothetical protein Kow0092_25740 [Deferrisomatales bacterium]
MEPLEIEEEIFTEAPATEPLRRFLDGLIRVRRDLYADPLLRTVWSCDPKRCRPYLGRNLCCKVEVRCPELVGTRCRVHGDKPFSCALFPLDLIRIDGVRAVTTVKNAEFFATGWSRYDRDMLRCFDGVDAGSRSMLEVQRPVLLRVFTEAEVIVMERALQILVEGGT